MSRASNVTLIIVSALTGLMGIALVAGGAWLISLGGSWYYLLAGLGLVLTALLLSLRRAEALWVYAIVVAATLAWALWEAGLDWWPLAARGDALFVLGAIILTRWVAGRLNRTGRAPSASRGPGLALSAVLVIALGVAVASWFTPARTA